MAALGTLRRVAHLGVVLDSGNVLIRPSDGRWFPPPAFYQILSEGGLTWDQARLASALAAGGAYLDDVHRVPLADERAEHLVWLRYYELVLEGIGITTGSDELANAVTAAWEGTLTVEPYPWTIPVLVELQQRDVPVVVLSDAWPSLRRWYRQLGLESFLRAMVISGEEGITKPDPRVFKKALELLGHEPRDVIFVDDHPGHVRAAVDLGIVGFRLRHPEQQPVAGVQELTDLRELLARI